MGAGPLDPLWLAGFNLAVFVHATFLGFLLIALTKERLELEQRTIAHVDPLTGLMNRRAFMTHVERNNRRRAGGREATSLLVLDLDHFKSVNDRFGHDVGDKVLASFAAIAEANVRPADQLYRMGGEEFCFVLPDTDLSEAITVAERIRREFASSAVEGSAGERIIATVSIGIASAEFAGFDYEVLLAAADAALYEAKARGRNRVIVGAPSALERSPVSIAKVEPLRRTA
jgi:diguanylate cyclase (GGDEF)-like protein